MRRTLLLLTMAGAMLLAFSGVVLAQQDRTTTSNSGEQGSAGNAGEVIQGKYIVVLRDGADPGAVASQHRERYGARVTHVYRHAIKGYAAELPQPAAENVSRDPRVEFVSEDRVVEALAQETPTGIDRIEGDTSSQVSGNGSGSANTAVAVIDTGSGPHSDLNVVGGKNCSTARSYNDGHGHGTHVAGTVAAKDNGAGVVGVAPGAPIYSVRVLNNTGSGSTSSVVCGIDWVTANASSLNIKVANMSLGGSGSDDGSCGKTNNDAEHKAICGSVAKGVTYVVAAGNSGTDFKGSVPAAYDEVLTVTAVADFNGMPGGGAAATCRSDVDETAADFSNFTTVGHADAKYTIAAPGVCIKSTWKDGGYNTISGTSMASPHVAGAAALCIASGACSDTDNDGKVEPSEVMNKLRSDANIRSGDNPDVADYYGYTDDPNMPIGGRYSGHLLYARGY